MSWLASNTSRSRQAFTLVEILVVIIILAALALIALPSLLGQRDKAKDSQTRANITNTYKALKAEYSTGELYSTAVVTSAIAGEPGINAIMVTGGADFSYPAGKIEVSLLNSQTVMVAGKAASGKTYLLAAKEQNPRGGVLRFAETNKFLSLAPITNLLQNPGFENNVSNWLNDGAVADVFAKDSSWSTEGTSSLHFRKVGTFDAGTSAMWGCPASTIVPGQNYVAAADMKVLQQDDTRGASLSVQWIGGPSHGVTVYSTKYTTPGVYNPVVSAVAPAGVTGCLVRAGALVNTGKTADFYVDGLFFGAVSGNPGSLNGNSPGWSWTGVDGQSTSQGFATGTSW